MNEDIRKFGFLVGLMCFFMSLIGLFVFGYMYFFMPERHGPNGSADILKVNIAAIAGIILGGWLIKKFGNSASKL